ADDTDLLHLSRLGLRSSGLALRALLDELEGIDRGLRLWSGKELCDRVLLPPAALVERPFAGALDQLERGVRRRGGAVHLVVDRGARAPEDRFGVRPVRLGALQRTLGEL